MNQNTRVVSFWTCVEASLANNYSTEETRAQEAEEDWRWIIDGRHSICKSSFKSMENRSTCLSCRRGRKYCPKCGVDWVSSSFHIRPPLLKPHSANAFALFVKSQRKWDSPLLSAENIQAFKRRMQEFGYSSKYVLPHGSYLINLGNPDEYEFPQLFIYIWWQESNSSEKRRKSFNCFLDDLQRCEQLGLELYNFQWARHLTHNTLNLRCRSPGSTVGQTTNEESIALIAECINNAHKATNYITIVLENMVCN